MLESMFENVGAEIKKLVNTVIYILMGVEILIGLIVFGKIISSVELVQIFGEGLSFLVPLLWIVIVLCVCGITRLSFIKLYAYGQLVENSDKMLDELKIIRECVAAEHGGVIEKNSPEKSGADASPAANDSGNDANGGGESEKVTTTDPKTEETGAVSQEQTNTAGGQQ